MTSRVLRSCVDDDNEHVLLSKIGLLVLWRCPHSVVFASFVAQVKGVMFLRVWERQCVPSPRAAQSVGSLDSPSSCTSLPARCFFGGFSGLHAWRRTKRVTSRSNDKQRVTLVEPQRFHRNSRRTVTIFG